MLIVVLNIIGILLILYSIYIIKKDISKDNIGVEDLTSVEERINEYYQQTRSIIGEFDELMETKLEMIDTKTIVNDKNQLETTNDRQSNTIINDTKIVSDNENLNPSYGKVIDLKTIGLTNEEIAKKLNKGIREIEIILKMYKSRN